MPESGRRRILKGVPGVWLALEMPLAHSATILAVRVWPARDYTRVTLELDAPLSPTHFTMTDPPRLVVDLPGIDLDAGLRELVAKVRGDDPYIAGVRAIQQGPGLARLVFDLKGPVSPKVFAVTPIGEYRHRVVLDLYPAQAPDPLADLIAQYRALDKDTRTPASPSQEDPLAALIRERERTQAPRPTGPPPAPRSAPRAARPARRLITVALDPGHGGEDPGAIGPGGTLEKDVVLAIATRLRERLMGEPNMRVLMTRDSDYFVSLATRVSKARAVSADLFVSIHADAFENPIARGSSVFVLSERGASSVSAKWMARQENRSDLIGGVEMRRGDREVPGVLIDLSTRSQIRQSRTLGNTVLGELARVGDMHKTAVEQAGFAVLRAPDIPSILVETAFISNPDEERKLADPAYQTQLANALFRGIRAYFQRHPPPPHGQPT